MQDNTISLSLHCMKRCRFINESKEEHADEL